MLKGTTCVWLVCWLFDGDAASQNPGPSLFLRTSLPRKLIPVASSVFSQWPRGPLRKKRQVCLLEIRLFTCTLPLGRECCAFVRAVYPYTCIWSKLGRAVSTIRPAASLTSDLADKLTAKLQTSELKLSIGQPRGLQARSQSRWYI